LNYVRASAFRRCRHLKRVNETSADPAGTMPQLPPVCGGTTMPDDGRFSGKPQRTSVDRFLPLLRLFEMQASLPQRCDRGDCPALWQPGTNRLVNTMYAPSPTKILTISASGAETAGSSNRNSAT
jgi:hypothetical protein